MFDNLRLKTKLTLTILLLSIIPFILVAIVSLVFFTENMKKQSLNQLVSVRNLKKEQVVDYFSFIKHQVKNFSATEFVKNSIGRFYGLKGTFSLLGKTEEERHKIAQGLFVPGKGDKLSQESQKNQMKKGFEAEAFLKKSNHLYIVTHGRFHKGYLKFIETSDFNDIFLISPTGSVIYSVRKERNFGTNLLTGRFSNSHLATIFKRVKATAKDLRNKEDVFIFEDFRLDLITGEVVAYVGTPVVHSKQLTGVLVFQMPLDKLNKIMGKRDRMGGTGETFLVGRDHLMRSASYRSSETYSVKNSFLNPQKLKVDTEPVNQALNGLSNIITAKSYHGDKVFSAYTPVDLFGVRWALLAEISFKEVNEERRNLQLLVFLIAFFTIVIVTLIALFLSNSLLGPLINLTDVAEEITKGDLEKRIEFRGRQDELGSLAQSFAHMRDSIREQIQLIEEKNQILAQKNLELEAADKLKDEFLANTSHELRTPINGIMGIAESMVEGATGELSEQQRDNLNIIVTSGRRLSHLVNDLLDFHKMKHNTLHLNPTGFSLKSVVKVVLDLSEHLIGQKPLRLMDLVADNLPKVYADQERLEQILYNLIGNAIKYTPEGKVVVGAEVKEAFILVSITDTGIGIPEEKREKIFEPLEQLDGSPTREYEGTGLGLSITKQLVSLHGGEIFIETQQEIGTTFSFTIPILKSESPVEEDSESPALLKRIKVNDFVPNVELVKLPPGDGKTILLVDDEIVNLQVLQNFLSIENYRLLIARDGEEALEIMESEIPDLILLDVMMPRMSGYEVCKIIRKDHNLLALPIIMLTARNRLKNLVEGFRCGANDYVVKPFYKDELFARVKAHIEAKESYERLKENKLLKEEIERRLVAEDELSNSQRRLARIIDSADDAILCLDENGKVCFFNQGANRMFEYGSSEILEQSVDDLFSEPIFSEKIQMVSENLKKGDSLLNFDKKLLLIGKNKRQELFKADLTVSCFKIEERPNYTLILNRIQESSSQETSSSTELIKEIEQNHERIKSLESALDSLNKHLNEKNSKLWVEVREDDPVLDGVSRAPSDVDQQENYRQLIVKVINLSLNYWSLCTNDTKVEFAEKSKIWKVYLDRSTWQTRTLDKYMSLETLPKRPRWRDVVRTGEFVLKNCSQEHEIRLNLEDAMASLREELHLK